MSGNRKPKEAVIMAVDCSQSMSNKSFKNDKSDFELTKWCLTNVVKQKLFAETKDEYLLVEFPTTKGFGIKPIGHLRQPCVDLIKYITNQLRPINKNEMPTNVIDALDETINVMIQERRGQTFSTSTIVLFTNFNDLSASDINCFKNQIRDKLQQHTIQLIIVSPFTSDSLSEDEATASQRMALDLMNFTEKFGLGKCLDFEAVIDHFDLFLAKKVSPYPWYANLELGQFLNAVKIPIAAQVKAVPLSRKPGKKAVPLESPQTSKMFSTSVSVEEEKKEMGYCYGDIKVPFSDEDAEHFQYNQMQKGIKIIKFAPSANVDYSQRFGKKTIYVFADPRPYQRNHELVFQTLVVAMIKSEKVAIVRYGATDRSAPQVGCLTPLKEDDKFLLVYHQLPFAEDVLELNFPSLSTEAFTPTEDQLETIDKLIDSMDLMTADTDDDGNGCEALINSQIADPSLQYWCEILYKKSLYDNEVDLPKMPQRFRNSIEMPEEMKKVELVLPEILDKFKLVGLNKKSPLRSSNDSDSSDSNEVSTKRPKVEPKLDIIAIKTGITDELKSGSNFAQTARKFRESLESLFENYCEELSEEITGIVEWFRKESVTNNERKYFNDFMLNYVNIFHGKDLSLSKEIKPIGDSECSGVNQQIIDDFITLSDDSFEDE